MVQCAEDNGGQIQEGEKSREGDLAGGLEGQDGNGTEIEEIGHARFNTCIAR